MARDKIRSFLSRDSLSSAEKALRGGDSARAMESFARAGQWWRAAQLAAELREDEKLLRYCWLSALGKVPPGDNHNLMSAAERLAAQGHPREAALLFERAGAFLQAAESARSARDLPLAAHCFKQAGAWLPAVRCLEEAGTLREALQMAEEGCRALEKAGGSPAGAGRTGELLSIRVDLLLRMGQPDAAGRLLSALPPSPRTAELLANAGRSTEAVECYLGLGLIEDASRLAARGPDSERLQARIFLRTGHPAEAGDLLARLGRSREAAEAYEAAKDWARAAYRWEAAGDPLRAAQAYEKGGRGRDAARCYEAAGMPRKAEEVSARPADRPASASPAHGDRLLRSARQRLAAGDKAGAASLLLQIQPDEKSFGKGTILLAPLLIEEGLGQEALKRLDQIPHEAGLPIETEVEYWMARGHESLGQRVAAIACFEQLMARDPDHRDARERLAELRNPTPPAAAASAPAEANTQAVAFPAVGGRLAERYEILAELGRGGMGRVYKAHDLELDEVVAIKTLLAPSEGFQEEKRLLREVQICRRINHPNVVRVYDIGRFAGGLFVTMEHIDGTSLEEVIVREAPLPFSRIQALLLGIAHGLQEAHAQGIVHRDLKPVNVMISGSRLKILDFGIAAMAGMGAKLTQVGFVMGTPMYMAPDQFLNREPDSRSDLYSLGLVAYALIAGREPYETHHPDVLMYKKLREAPPDIRKLRPETPTAWVALLERLLEKEPEDRFQTAQEVVEALEGLPVGSALP